MTASAKLPLRLRLRLKVHQQLVIIFSVLILALSAVAFLTILALFEESENTIWAGRQRDAALNAAAQILTLIDQAQSILQTLAEFPRSAFIANPLQPILQTNPSLEELAFIAPNGRVIARAFRHESDLFANIQDVSALEWFEKSLEVPKGLFFLGELEPSQDHLVQLLLTTHADNGSIVAAVLNMDALNDIAARARFGKTGVAYVAEAEGLVVAHSDPALRGKLINLAGRSELPAVEDRDFIGRLGESPDSTLVRALDYVNFQDVFVLGTTATVSGTDIVVFVESAQSEIHEGQNRALAILSLALSLTALVAIVIVRQAVRRGIELPIERLQQGAQRVAQGDLTYQVPISYRDEIGEVTEAFNAMTRQLYERTRQKARQDIRLRALYELAASTADFKTQLTEALRVGVEALNADIGTISRITGETNTILHVYPASGMVKVGMQMPLSQTYCDLTLQTNNLVTIDHMRQSPYRDHPCYAAMGMEMYIGVPLVVAGERFGTLSFASKQPRAEPFAAFDKDFFLLMGQWVSSLLERQQNEAMLLQRDAILAAVSFAAQRLLASATWESSISEILAQLGKATSSSRVYIFESRLQDGVWLCDQRFEWVAEGIKPEIDNPDLQGVNMSELFPRWVEKLAAGEPISGLVRDFPSTERALLEPQQIISILVLPILVEGQWWGFIGFDECRFERHWDALEIELISTVAANISAAIARQRQERALRESRERLLQIANSIEGAIYEFHVDGGVWRIGYISQGIYSLSGVTAEEVMADVNSLIRTFHPDDLKPFIDSVNAVLIDHSNWRFEGRLYHRQTGELRWWRAESVPMLEDGHVVFKGVIFDITERRRAEEQVQRQNEALVKANRELAVARRQAEVASKLKSQFLATMSHELRTPLNAIIGYAQLQLAGMVGEMTPEQLAYQDRILINAQHLLQLINQVLDLSKIEAGRLELAEKPFSLRACLGEVMTQNKVLADSKGLDFALEVDERLPEVIIGDYGRIKQIVINLVANAIKFTDRGGVTVKAELGDADTWRLSVTDTGVGIPPHQQEVIFDEFHQAENGLDRGGTGLGLAIVRKLVLTMRGTIRVSSEVGRGSTFTVTLPLVTEKRATQTLSTTA
ncbi:MAG: ATP-binding protein [Anaerolineae bacterium]|nr:ATP-binding protein [Anaerolineae bacterium]